MIHLQRISCALVLGALFASTGQPTWGQEQQRRPDEPHSAETRAAGARARIPPERTTATRHDLLLDGKTLHDTATAEKLAAEMLSAGNRTAKVRPANKRAVQ